MYVYVYGNTSACAEKSTMKQVAERLQVEIPPRARRREGMTQRHIGNLGNTSACAEKR